LFSVLEREISGRDLILIGGGLFLLAKSTLEIHGKLEGQEGPERKTSGRGFWMLILQILALDVVFSVDSVITAIGLANRIPVMVLAIVIAVLVMMFSAGAVDRFIERHPTFKILALSFLLLIGLALVADGVDVHIPKSSIYFAMGFSVFVEFLNTKLTRPKKRRDRDEHHGPHSRCSAHLPPLPGQQRAIRRYFSLLSFGVFWRRKARRRRRRELSGVLLRRMID
jgi:predicted tellurium resistance membrane protein TerC